MNDIFSFYKNIFENWINVRQSEKIFQFVRNRHLYQNGNKGFVLGDKFYTFNFVERDYDQITTNLVVMFKNFKATDDKTKIINSYFKRGKFILELNKDLKWNKIIDPSISADSRDADYWNTLGIEQGIRPMTLKKFRDFGEMNGLIDFQTKPVMGIVGRKSKHTCSKKGTLRDTLSRSRPTDLLLYLPTMLITEQT